VNAYRSDKKSQFDHYPLQVHSHGMGVFMPFLAALAQSIGDGFSNRIFAVFSDKGIVAPFRESFEGSKAAPQLRFNLTAGQSFLLIESGLRRDESRPELNKVLRGDLSSLQVELIGCAK
jgi:hypothetical protein